MNATITTGIILLATLIAINLTCIIINHFVIKAEINDILDKDLRIDLLQSLQPIYKIFFKRVIISANTDYFSCKEDYIRYSSYLNIEGLQEDLNNFYHKSRRKEHTDYELFNEFKEKKVLEVEEMF